MLTDFTVSLLQRKMYLVVLVLALTGQSLSYYLRANDVSVTNDGGSGLGVMNRRTLEEFEVGPYRMRSMRAKS